MPEGGTLPGDALQRSMLLMARKEDDWRRVLFDRADVSLTHTQTPESLAEFIKELQNRLKLTGGSGTGVGSLSDEELKLRLFTTTYYLRDYVSRMLDMYMLFLAFNAGNWLGQMNRVIPNATVGNFLEMDKLQMVTPDEDLLFDHFRQGSNDLYAKVDGLLKRLAEATVNFPKLQKYYDSLRNDVKNTFNSIISRFGWDYPDATPGQLTKLDLDSPDTFADDPEFDLTAVQSNRSEWRSCARCFHYLHVLYAKQLQKAGFNGDSRTTQSGVVRRGGFPVTNVPTVQQINQALASLNRLNLNDLKIKLTEPEQILSDIPYVNENALKAFNFCHTSLNSKWHIPSAQGGFGRSNYDWPFLEIMIIAMPLLDTTMTPNLPSPAYQEQFFFPFTGKPYATWRQLERIRTREMDPRARLEATLKAEARNSPCQLPNDMKVMMALPVSSREFLVPLQASLQTKQPELARDLSHYFNTTHVAYWVGSTLIYLSPEELITTQCDQILDSESLTVFALPDQYESALKDYQKVNPMLRLYALLVTQNSENDLSEISLLPASELGVELKLSETTTFPTRVTSSAEHDVKNVELTWQFYGIPTTVNLQRVIDFVHKLWDEPPHWSHEDQFPTPEQLQRTQHPVLRQKFAGGSRSNEGFLFSSEPVVNLNSVLYQNARVVNAQNDFVVENMYLIPAPLFRLKPTILMQTLTDEIPVVDLLHPIYVRPGYIKNFLSQNPFIEGLKLSKKEQNAKEIPITVNAESEVVSVIPEGEVNLDHLEQAIEENQQSPTLTQTQQTLNSNTEAVTAAPQNLMTVIELKRLRDLVGKTFGWSAGISKTFRLNFQSVKTVTGEKLNVQWRNKQFKQTDANFQVLLTAPQVKWINDARMNIQDRLGREVATEAFGESPGLPPPPSPSQGATFGPSRTQERPIHITQTLPPPPADVIFSEAQSEVSSSPEEAPQEEIISPSVENLRLVLDTLPNIPPEQPGQIQQIEEKKQQRQRRKGELANLGVTEAQVKEQSEERGRGRRKKAATRRFGFP